MPQEKTHDFQIDSLTNLSQNIYTYYPKQNPNIILGSFQILFWFFFRPSAWKNHISSINPSNDNNIFLLSFWNQKYKKTSLKESSKIYFLYFQSVILLPFFTIFITSVIQYLLGKSHEEIFSDILMASVLSPIFIVLGGTIGGLAYGSMLGMSYGATITATNIDYLLKGIVGGLAGGIACGLAMGVTGGVAYGRKLSGALTLPIFIFTFWTLGDLNFSIAFFGGLLINWFRPLITSLLLVPWHILIYILDRIGSDQRSISLLRYNSAFWDEWNYLNIWGLEQHLMFVVEHFPLEGSIALNYLTNSPQKWAAKAVQIELDARILESCYSADEIAHVHQDILFLSALNTSGSFIRSLNRLSKDIKAALEQSTTYNQRLTLISIEDKLDILVRELRRSSDKYAARFRPIAQRWVNIIALHIQELEKESELSQEIDSPYIIGVPLTDRQEIFVGRTDISSRIEQLLLDRRRPPLLLYGQRRTGKTSLLNNLGRLLPNSIVPLFVDLQGPVSRASSPAGFLYNLAKSMVDSADRQRNLTLPSLSRETLADDPFTVFDEWLDSIEVSLENSTALLALDEFEALDQALVDGRFNEIDILGMLRNLIQHRPRFKVMLAGSHTLNEFQRWSSYLINAQVLHLSYLTKTEARQLIEQPCPGFALRYDADASQRVLDLTRGHPFLVQLLCAEIVVLKNEQEPKLRRHAMLADVETAIPEALSSGSMFFSDIERNQVDGSALVVLRAIANQGEGAIVPLAFLADQNVEGLGYVLKTLLQRELVEQTDNGYRVRVELIRRWFEESA